MITGVPLDNGDGSFTFQTDMGEPLVLRGAAAAAAFRNYAAQGQGSSGRAELAPIETTRLTPEQEAAFKSWAKKHNIRDVDHPDSHYDYRGAFVSGMKPGPDAHWPDTFKQTGHETFSNESQYAIPGARNFGYWEGDKFVRPLPPADLDEAYRRQSTDVGPRRGVRQ